MNHAAIHTVVHTAQEPDEGSDMNLEQWHGVKTRAKVIPERDALPEFMLVPDTSDHESSLVYALVDGVARFKGRIRHTEKYRYGGREYGEGWLAEIPGNEGDPDHFTDNNCRHGAKATAINRLLATGRRA